MCWVVPATPGVPDTCFLFPYLLHRYVEQSNLMMEKRNNSLQTATENTQARVLHAEQEKVKKPRREKPKSGCVEPRSVSSVPTYQFAFEQNFCHCREEN